MKNIVVILCIVAVSNAIPTTDYTKKVPTSKLDSSGPQPVDEVAITNGGEENSSKRVARHYGYGGVGYGVPVVAYTSYYPTYGYGGYGGYPYYGGGYGYGGGWSGYGGGWGGYGGGWGGYGGGWGHHHHHHRHW